MERKTRRANLKKLQEPAVKQRTTRSNKPATSTTTLSEYFDSQPNHSNEATPLNPAGEPINSDKDDFFAEPKHKKSRGSHDTKPLPKKAPKLKSSAATARRGRATGRGRGKQPSISDFLRNEQLFAEVTEQHCRADNFSADDIEMALALSKSEAEKHGILRLEDSADAEEEVVNLLEGKLNQSTEIIRRKLQKYGFRTASKEDYNVLYMGNLPAKRSKRCRWASKFTALTLRNPEEQLKKVDNKVAALLAQQVSTKLPTSGELLLAPFELISDQLQLLKATFRITHEPSESTISNLSAYFVEDLFEVCRTPAHHLLKSWAAIQGRDLSPKRASLESQQRQQQLEQIYGELEAHFGATAEQAELDELEKLVADNMVQEEEDVNINQCTEEKKQLPPCTVVEERQGEKLLVNISAHLQPSKSSVKAENQPEDKENLLPRSSVNHDENPNRPLRETENLDNLRCSISFTNEHKSLMSNASRLPTQITRCTSPDLFADSDEELNIEMPATLGEVQNFSLKVYKETTSSSMNCYEIFSSDEVKTAAEATNNMHCDLLIEPSIVDLTEEADSTELPIDAAPGNFLATLSQQSLALSTTDNSDNEPECVVSKELYAKYANETMENEAKECSANLSKISTTVTSFDLSIAKSPSCSLTRSCTQRQLQMSHSPLSRKSISFNDKSAFIYNQSDASIDLTQDSAGDEDDDEGVLLSDDEINYSIWKAERTQCSSIGKRKSLPYFQTLEELDAFLDAKPTSPAAFNKSCNFRSPNRSALSKERAEFGILDAALSQPLTLSQLLSSEMPETSQEHVNWADASFLDTPPEQALKRYSCSRSNHKFKQLLSIIPTTAAADNDDDELDEFDRMVFHTANDTTLDEVPSGLDRLLNAEINMETLPEIVSLERPVKAIAEQLEVNGQLYTVRVCETPKPDFVLMSEAELLQRLYNYGIKPLKRKQAVKLLEFIYNQTHPIMLPLRELEVEPKMLPRCKSTPVSSKPRNSLPHTASNNCLTPTDRNPSLSCKLKDAIGSELLRFSQTMAPALCDDFELYVLQTNVTKKTPQPLLPLHIAWHNLVCANPRLHESVLMYEPIDLQQIYQYLKEMGHRYDPKDLKGFFDRRCIIFRYELASSTKQVQKHIHKKTKKASAKP